ncbi:MAG: hypothetical protein IAE84_18695 [Saprospiraceae bacterium]|nr:hypothetical protein [Saprospiraceae bacterium]HRF40942.1 hypothetical protein [Saprospiraceae bacterium]HRJ16882.1 hypothetical protein [Saprospiraceae bacterium]HRK83650.1 hypothetical protein [Saprospiraceae bacterium]
MEQQAFYIVFAIIGMAIVGIVSWAATYSSRNDYDDYYRHPGGYPPPYYPPYPPHYPQPQRESPIMTLLGLGLVVFLIFSMMQYCERVEERKRLQRIHDEDNNVVGVPPTVDSSNWGDSTNYEPPLTVPVTEYDVQPENERPPVSPHDGFYFQKSASHDDGRILDAAQQLETSFPGRVFIGVVDDGTGFPYKLLIGPYDTEAAAQSVHGRGSNIYRPADEGVQIYNPR